MKRTFFKSLFIRPPLHSLSAKLLLPITGLMLASLLGSTLAFGVGTARTQAQLLQQQVTADAVRMREALLGRAEVVLTAATLLTKDPGLLEAIQLPPEEIDTQLHVLNNRAVIMRDRFELDVIQIYNRSGDARTNLVSSSLYRVSFLLDAVQGNGPVIQVVEDKLLLLSRATLPNGLGTVITGLDLEAELRRLALGEGLPADLGLNLGQTQIGTRGALPANLPNGQNENLYLWHTPLALGGVTLDLVAARPTADITRVTNAGLMVMIGSSLLTTLLLIIGGVWVTRRITLPVHRLAIAAETLAKGDLSQQVEIVTQQRPLAIGSQDEIGLLAQAFNTMVTELRELYTGLEAKVEARTQQLATAAEVARAASSSLELDVVLRTSVGMLCERFGFYSASVFIVEPGMDTVVLREAAGDAGKALKAKKYQLRIGSRSLIGRATAERRPIVVQDVSQDSIYFQNPHLPDTRAEAVIPLLIGETVSGVLDVQSTHLNAFTPDIVALLTTLADQIAIAVQNASLYAQQRETVERLKEVDRLKTQFLGNMSHELRTPLNAIIGFSRLMIKEVDGPLTELQTQDLTAIYNSGQHLLGLINDVLDLSKINAGQMELVFEEVNLREMIVSVLATGRALVNDKPITLMHAIDLPLPLVQADGTRIRQVLLNLLSNAIKFTDHGQITVRARYNPRLQVGSLEVEPCVEISVSDTGPGIAAEDMNKLFRPFSQVDDSPTRRAGGTGLGLAISRHIVEMHGGLIWAKSELRRGSTFTFTLPLKPLKPNETRAATPYLEQELTHVA